MFRTCRKCNTIKPITEFHKQITGRDGFRSRCKGCRKDEGKEYRKNNKDIITIRKRKYSQNNREKIRIINRNYYEQNKERIKERSNTKIDGYDKLHKYIRRNKNKSLYCIICNQQNKLDLVSIDHKYTYNVDDYLWLCRSCHKIFDNCRRGW